MRTGSAPPGPAIVRSSTLPTASAQPRATGFASILRRACAADMVPKSSEAPALAIAWSSALVCGSSGILLPERGFQRGYDLLDRIFALVEVVRHADEPVNRPVVAGAGHRHAGLAQPGRVRFALVAQRIEFGGDDQRRRQTFQFGGVDWGGVRMRTVLVVAQIMVPEPDHRTPGQ